MFVNQVSVFIENKKGTIAEVISVLGNNNINIKALSVCDNAEFGILRLIVNKPEETKEIIEKSGFRVKLANVIAIAVSDTPNGLGAVLNLLKENNLDITYIYSFTGIRQDKAIVVLKTSDLDRTVSLLEENGTEMVAPEEIYGEKI